MANRGALTTSPNPMVGCVITHDNKIIGRGWHVRSGENHAEINAIEDVINNLGDKAKEVLKVIRKKIVGKNQDPRVKDALEKQEDFDDSGNLLQANQTNNAIFFGIIFILIFFTHRENIKRLKNKEESKTKIY